MTNIEQVKQAADATRYILTALQHCLEQVAVDAVLQMSVDEPEKTAEYLCGMGVWYWQYVEDEEDRWETEKPIVDGEDVNELFDEMLNEFGWAAIPAGHVMARNGEITNREF